MFVVKAICVESLVAAIRLINLEYRQGCKFETKIPIDYWNDQSATYRKLELFHSCVASTFSIANVAFVNYLLKKVLALST